MSHSSIILGTSMGEMFRTKFGQLILISSDPSADLCFLSILCVDSFSPMTDSSLIVLPMMRFTDEKVFFGFTTCCRLAFSPGDGRKEEVYIAVSIITTVCEAADSDEQHDASL